MPSTFVIVGGANTEQVLLLRRPIVAGEKHSVSYPAERTAGGGGLNQAVRLAMAGAMVVPVLPIGSDDGGNLCADVLNAALGGGSVFKYPEHGTSHSTILLDNERHRTIFSHDGKVESVFGDTVSKRTVDAIVELGGDSSYALLVGHIREHAVETTKKLFVDSRGATLRLFFPGRSQFGRCYHSWGNEFWNRIDYLQLEKSEARSFVSASLACDECLEQMTLADPGRIKDVLKMKDRYEAPTLESIMRLFLHVNLTAVVTLDHRGAFGVVREADDESVFLSLPYVIEDLSDPTGAGDAFGAGVALNAMAFAVGDPAQQIPGVMPFCQSTFADILDTGTLYGAIACREYGGASKCPSAAEIDQLRMTWGDCRLGSTRQMTFDEARRWLYLLDE